MLRFAKNGWRYKFKTTSKSGAQASPRPSSDQRYEHRPGRELPGRGFSGEIAQVSPGAGDRLGALQDRRYDGRGLSLTHHGLRLLPSAGTDPQAARTNAAVATKSCHEEIPPSRNRECREKPREPFPTETIPPPPSSLEDWALWPPPGFLGSQVQIQVESLGLNSVCGVSEKRLTAIAVFPVPEAWSNPYSCRPEDASKRRG
jgi:hypothetical protein